MRLLHSVAISASEVWYSSRLRFLSVIMILVISRFRGARDNSVAAGLQVLGDVATGLLVNERVVNCPPQIGPPLMQALFDEISWAVEDEPTEVKPFCLILRTAGMGSRLTL